ncbi:MAG: YesL family protein [Candidatus Ruminococcus intestinipullorum]|nr:YesL family protein [Candidatus Ruminococcus intestinipullorum]
MNWTDNVVTRGLGKVADFMILNVLWIICSIPIVTIGAATTAMYSVMLRLVKDEEGYIVKGFFKAFKENFKQSTIMWLIYMVVGTIIFVDINFARVIGGQKGIFLQMFFLVLSAVLFGMGIYIFSLQARYVNSIKLTIKNAALLTIGRLPYTVLLIVVSGGAILLTFLTVETLAFGILFWLFLGVSVVCWLNSLILHRVFAIFDK